MLRLIMRRGPTPGAIYELEDDEITLGRGSKNQIVIRDNEVSREHCRLVRLMDDYEVVDLNSSNGTFVNGQRVVGSWLLQPGAIVELGDSITLEYERLHYSFAQKSTPTPRSTPAVAESTTVRYKYYLMMTMGPSVGHIYPLTDVIITIGRDLSNDIVIQDPEISRYHLRLRRQKQSYSAEDMGSTNGTFVNNVPLPEAQMLESDDVIKLGTMVQLQYVCQPVEEEEEEPEDADLTLHTKPLSGDPQIYRDETIRLTFVNGSFIKTSRLGTGLEPGVLDDHIFIAYSREDWEAVVASLTLSMQDAGLKAWVDQYLIQGSDDWRAAVEQALIECRMMVLVVSPQSLNNHYVQMAYRHFLEQDKSVIPLLYQSVKPLPGELGRLRSILYDVENPRKSFHKLIFEIMQLRRS
jgi:pSer/pThr/pTyr-binding forkhead associated (FHA) protein